jgi:hypothetical protein
MRSTGRRWWPEFGTVALTGAILSLALTGCGTGRVAQADRTTDEDQIVEALKTHMEAQAEGDGERACAQLTQKEQRVQGEGLGAGSSCVSAVSRRARLLPPDADVVEIRAVRLINGDRAEVIAEFPRETDRVAFKRVDGKWKIDSFAELSSKE